MEAPGRRGPGGALCPIREPEVARSKFAQQRKARIDARTREWLPVLPELVRTVDQRCKEAAALLESARQIPPSQAITTAAGQKLVRAGVPTGATRKVWVGGPGQGKAP